MFFLNPSCKQRVSTAQSIQVYGRRYESPSRKKIESDSTHWEYCTSPTGKKHNIHHHQLMQQNCPQYNVTIVIYSKDNGKIVYILPNVKL